MPLGTTLDSGGIGKGLAADIVCEFALAEGAWGVMAELGGDIVVAGEAPDGVAWALGRRGSVRHDTAPDHRAHDRGAIVTSSQRKRRFVTADGERHHLIDPATGSSVVTRIQTATVIAATGAALKLSPSRDSSASRQEFLEWVPQAGRCSASRRRRRATQLTSYELGKILVNLSDPHLWWYITRASALLAWGLMTLSVVWGILLSTRLLRRIDNPGWLQDLHRFLGGLSVIMVFLHMATLMLDGWLQFTLVEVFVPFATDYRPLAVALGIVGFYLLVAVQGSSMIMHRLPRKLWKAAALRQLRGRAAHVVPRRARRHGCRLPRLQDSRVQPHRTHRGGYRHPHRRQQSNPNGGEGRGVGSAAQLGAAPVAAADRDQNDGRVRRRPDCRASHGGALRGARRRDAADLVPGLTRNAAPEQRARAPVLAVRRPGRPTPLRPLGVAHRDVGGWQPVGARQSCRGQHHRGVRPAQPFRAGARAGVPLHRRGDRHHTDQGDDRVAACPTTVAAALHRSQSSGDGIRELSGGTVSGSGAHPRHRRELRPDRFHATHDTRHDRGVLLRARVAHGCCGLGRAVDPTSPRTVRSR